ncbi:alkaline phosphatase family protein [Bosea sp. 685]|uniref:alkaline phosphatase family protein n=1 Tax=Bosea sp. 685 TaxID=3080057 RepID=UPI00289313FA|nr:alkaline phosphatase family protein [Bosea sp. 685]WNJ87999.1 alkaline phosphatase family protein [Bosea sp. 685]
MTPSTPSASKMVVCVFDGLRPDFVTPERMPNLSGFAEGSSWFRQARSVFPSLTRPASASIATGAPPRVHGVVGNSFLFPEVTREHILDLGSLDDILLAERHTEGRLVDTDTFADVLARNGRSMACVHSGSAGAAYVMNPRAARNGHWTFSIHGRDGSVTPEAVDEVVARFGPLPPRELPRFAEIDYAELVFREHVLERMRPDLALIWFNEPDTSFHYRFLGSDETASVVRAADAAFGRILDWIDRQPDAECYTVIAASDHGQITMTETLPLHELLRAAGHENRQATERMLTGAHIALTDGNMGEIRILQGGTARRDDIANWLMEQDFLGMLFSCGGDGIEGEVPGTFPLSLVDLDHARAPDLIYVLRSHDGPDAWGHPGVGIVTAGDVPVGGGMHGGLHSDELNTVLIGRGAGFAAGTVDPRSCGIVDIAPTVLAALGLPPAAAMTGRSLLAAAGEAGSPVVHETGRGRFRQRLTSVERDRSRILLRGERVA